MGWGGEWSDDGVKLDVRDCRHLGLTAMSTPSPLTDSFPPLLPSLLPINPPPLSLNPLSPSPPPSPPRLFCLCRPYPQRRVDTPSPLPLSCLTRSSAPPACTWAGIRGAGSQGIEEDRCRGGEMRAGVGRGLRGGMTEKGMGRDREGGGRGGYGMSSGDRRHGGRADRGRGGYGENERQRGDVDRPYSRPARRSYEGDL